MRAVISIKRLKRRTYTGPLSVSSTRSKREGRFRLGIVWSWVPEVAKSACEPVGGQNKWDGEFGTLWNDMVMFVFEDRPETERGCRYHLHSRPEAS